MCLSFFIASSVFHAIPRFLSSDTTQWKFILLESPKTSHGQMQWTFSIVFDLSGIWNSLRQEILILSFKRYQSFLIFPFRCSLAFPILLFSLCPPFKCCDCLRCHPQTSFDCIPQILNPRYRAPHTGTPVKICFLLCIPVQRGSTGFIRFSKGYKP